MVNFDELKQSILYVVLEEDNLRRMNLADPVTLESAKKGGLLPRPVYPENFSVLIAYERDTDELYRKAQEGGAILLKWLERGRVFKPGVDGVGEAFRIPGANERRN